MDGVSPRGAPPSHSGSCSNHRVRKNRGSALPPHRDSMIDAVLAKIFGTQNERDVKAIRPLIAAINALEPEVQKLTDIDLAAKTIEFREKLAKGIPLDDLLVEAFAVVRETGRRVLNM